MTDADHRRESPPPVVEVDIREVGRVTPGRAAPIIDSLEDRSGYAGEELRLLAARAQELRRERQVRCLAVTSALPQEGKSTVCLGLAAALAREPGRRVLLIEADLRRPSIARDLELPPSAGLGEFLGGAAGAASARIVDPGGFSLVVAGRAEFDRPETLASPRMAALVGAARSRYDFVLLDVPPLIPVTDAVLVQEIVDGFLVVVRSRKTPRAALDEALGRLRSGAVLGLVLNDHHVGRGSYRAAAYRRYGVAG